MRLRLELFVKSVPESADFYRRVLGFEAVSHQPDGYSVLRLGGVQLSLEARASLPDDHPIKPRADERAGLAVEIVLEVDDLDAAYARALAAGWPISEPIAQRPWGTRDFRVVDPNGLYIRINELTPLP